MTSVKQRHTIVKELTADETTQARWIRISAVAVTLARPNFGARASDLHQFD